MLSAVPAGCVSAVSASAVSTSAVTLSLLSISLLSASAVFGTAVPVSAACLSFLSCHLCFDSVDSVGAASSRSQSISHAISCWCYFQKLHKIS